ncbi:methyl-accepting chemotaxis protein [Marinomonas sp. A3A]|jgi:methyl-accepting chemotaxis protein|uniref:methyl-accepting chemotaxis protein n=1 Tax=Marinomonas sp. A3A TaxID=2065312 RepID=UPI001BB372D5|nr:methyl-accepting chemotaxis protein [Marinomonas sp. A3A]QUX92331.1 methyl-accepting chemotaxis protein [Marinomonas sp. A3A]
MKNIKLSVLLFSSYGLIVLGLIMIVVLSFTRMNNINSQSTVISEDWLPSVRLVERINTQTADLRNAEAVHIISHMQEEQAKAEKEIEDLKSKIAKSIDSYRAMSSSQEETSLLKQFEQEYKNYLGIQNQLLNLSRQNEDEAARSLFMSQSLMKYNQYSDVLLKLSEVNTEGANLASKNGDMVYQESISILAISAAVIVVMVCIVAFYITRTLTQQVGYIQNAMTRLSGGDLSFRLDNVSRSELGMLASHFNTTIEQLSTTVNDIQDAATQLASTSEELSTVTEKSTQDMHQQNEQLELAVSAVTEMTSAVEDVARNAVSTSKDSDIADERAELGRDQVQQTIKTIQSLLTELKTTTQGVNDLAAQVSSIGSVLDVIRGIADQTNLLALNAAIEAARAGETGRGFAVVADEVRALAHRTQESTKDIEKMIQSVQSGTDVAVSSMQRSHDKANATLDIANLSGDALKAIAESVSRINDQNIAIASSAEEQALVAREVDKNLLAIRDIANEAVAGANQSSAASLDLARLAENLNGLTKRFKLLKS